ncbi:MAG: undecaprenyl-diphosphate phosphatase [Candidatus Omnitrophica bacterium]|nr:undecaprenyl-diphosphate phosphatase [Candidatus Omnitrophota bacterium]
MTVLQALVLGTVQGLTEFLPVSSTAHLVIIQNWFGLHNTYTLLVFDIVVHLGTLLSLFIYFGKEYVQQKSVVPGTLRDRFFAKSTEPVPAVPGTTIANLIWLIVIATIPTGILGLLFKKWMEESFNSLRLTVITLVINSFILLSTYWTTMLHKKELKKWLDAFWIGVAQGISILPGISRSGATVAAALWLKIKPEEAARFSFLIAIPAILGATLIVLPQAIPHISSDEWPVMIAGFLSALISGYVAILIVFKVILRGKFHYFAFYTFILAAVTFIFTMAH